MGSLPPWYACGQLVDLELDPLVDLYTAAVRAHRLIIAVARTRSEVLSRIWEKLADEVAFAPGRKT